MSAPPNANLSIGVGLNPGSAPVNSKIQRFNLEVFIPRIIASCIVVAVGSVSFVMTCIIILNLLTSSSRSPNKAFPIFTLSGGLGIILVTSVPIFLVLIHAKVSHVFPATMRKRRIERLKTEMAPEKIGCMVLHTLSTILLMLGMILLGPREFSQVSVMCQNTRRCLNGFMVFPLLVGMFLSCRLTFAHYFRNGALVNYPCIKQHRFIQGKSAFASALRMAWRSALRDVPFFCLTFVVLGNQFSKWLSQYVELGFSYEPFWTDWRFFLSMLIFAVVLVTVHEFSWAIFQIFITQHHEFEISQELDPPLSLLTALEDESNLQLNYLAHMDFCHLAQHSPLRRKSVFALSPIGGKPKSFTAVMSHCLKLMDKMSEDLEKLTKPPAPSSAVLPSVQPSYFYKAELSGFRNLMTQNCPGDATPLVNKGSPKQSVQSPQSLSQPVQSPQKQAPTLESLPLATLLQRFLLQQFHHWVQKLTSHMMSNSLFRYLFGETPDGVNLEPYVHAKRLIWTTKGLSFLVSASYAEDVHGVVQFQLAKILVAYLRLYRASEGHHVPMSSKSQQRMHLVSLRDALRLTVKEALYRITSKFGQCLQAVNMCPEDQALLSEFIAFQE